MGSRHYIISHAAGQGGEGAGCSNREDSGGRDSPICVEYLSEDYVEGPIGWGMYLENRRVCIVENNTAGSFVIPGFERQSGGTPSWPTADNHYYAKRN